MKVRRTHKFLSLLISTALVFIMLPAMSVTAYAAGASAPTVDAPNKTIYGNGSPLLITGTAPANTSVYWDKNGNGVVDAVDIGLAGGNLAEYDIYGGAEGTPLTCNPRITMTGGKVHSIYVGGYYSAAITGYTTFTMSGGEANGVKGGGYASTLSGKAYITVRGNGYINFLMGGTQSTDTSGSSITVMETARVNFIYGGSQYGGIDGDVDITVSDNATVGYICGSGAGSNNNPIYDKVNGNVTINLNGGTIGLVQANAGTVVVSGTKTINVRGNPKIGNKTTDGIQLDTASSLAVRINGQLTGNAGDITLINPANSGAANTVVATATNTAYADAGKFTLSGKLLYTEGANIKIGTPITISFNQQGGTGGASSTTARAGTLLPASVAVPTRIGYTFGGYFTSANGAGTMYYTASGARNGSLTYDISCTLYAKWTANTYTMTLDRQGGTGGTASGTLTYGSPIPQSVTPPTKAGYTFDGYYSSANGTGTQYYSNTGARVYQTAWAAAGGTTLYAKWIALYTLTFDDQGGSGGQGSAAGNSGTAIPASVTVPKRLGYTFGGYYTAANGGGEKYYDASGARNGAIHFTGSRNIFAGWIVKTSTLTLDPAGGAMGGSADTKTETKNYNDMTNIPTPAREGHTFLGWRVENAREITDPATDKHGSYNKTANKFTFGTVDATMTALWLAQSNVDYDVVDGTGSGSLLDGSLGTIVTDDKGGVTEEDVAEGNTVSLKLTVAEKAVTDAPSSDLIEEIKQGDSVQYYDVKVEKTVTTQGGGETTTTLTTTPKPVRAIIPIPAGIQGRTSYAVYRIHEGIASVIPADPAAPEYYEVNSGGTTLTLHVRKFSTYAVVSGDKSLSGSGNLGGDNGTNSTGSGMDVQGKILEGTLGTYKLDVSWGAMKFDFNAAGMVWDPDTHSYTPGGTQGWTNESFEKGNNKITVTNHSNGDVLLGYLAVPNTSLSGVTMTVHSTNSLEGIEAEDILLEKVPTESAEAPTVDTYVWLTGTPTDLVTLTKESYTKAGVITVTAAADMTSGLTPKNP